MSSAEVFPYLGVQLASNETSWQVLWKSSASFDQSSCFCTFLLILIYARFFRRQLKTLAKGRFTFWVQLFPAIRCHSRNPSMLWHCIHFPCGRSSCCHPRGQVVRLSSFFKRVWNLLFDRKCRSDRFSLTAARCVSFHAVDCGVLSSENSLMTVCSRRVSFYVRTCSCFVFFSSCPCFALKVLAVVPTVSLIWTYLASTTAMLANETVWGLC